MKTRAIVRLLFPCVCAWLVFGGRLTANPNDEVKRVEDAITVLHELTSTPEKGIPQRLLSGADAIIVIPNLVKGGFVIGAKHGRGVMSTRLEGGEFSMPGFVTMTGGNIGWQIGVESIDLVFLVMNRKGVDDLLDDRFTVGGNASVAAGPVGRNAEAATDAKVGSEILAYSRTSGLFAGATFEGAALKNDKDANESFYGKRVDLRTVLDMHAPSPGAPAIAARWRSTLRELAGSAHGTGR